MARDKDNLQDNTKEEVDTMALAQRINPGFILSRGKEEAFFKKVNQNRPTKDFWDECEQIRNHISKEAIDEMNILMDKDKQ